MEYLKIAKDYLLKAWWAFSWADLRWSHLALVGAALLCVVISLVLPHGWTVWPMLPVVALLIVVNEAVDRNGQGLPPIQVYLFFAAVVFIWIVSVLILSQINVLVQLMTVGAVTYYLGKLYLAQRERDRVIQERRDQGCCIYCGEPAAPEQPLCLNCGLEVDPQRTSLDRTLSIVRYGKRSDRARSVLKQESQGNIAARKEKELLAKSVHRRGRPPKRG